MKNKSKFSKFLFIILIFFIFVELKSKELDILSDTIEFNNISGVTNFKKNVTATDEKGNILTTDSADYDSKNDKLIAFFNTKISTKEGYNIIGSQIIFDNLNGIISSEKETVVIDKDGNQIFLSMFEYNRESGLIFSRGNIEVKDTRNSIYKFTQIYIDQNKKEMVGTDVKGYLGNDYKIDPLNEPRFFSNSMILKNEVREFDKGVFTYCRDRGVDKCPVWNLQAEKITHDIAKKTIYYKNAVLKIFDFPIFYFPNFFHPDPTVKRKSGLLAPTYADSTNLGSSITSPVFWAVDADKDLTFTPKIYSSENPLLFLEYRQAFQNSNLLIDTGFTEGYKKTDINRTAGSRSHFFSQFIRVIENDDFISNLEINIQRSSNDTYLKIHDVNNILAKKEIEILENKFEYLLESEDSIFGASFLVSEDLSKENNFRYEYLLPSVTFQKNLFAGSKFGELDLVSNIRVRNFDVNNQTEFFVNDLNWKSEKKISDIGIDNEFGAQLKVVGYNADTETGKSFKTTGGQAEVSGVLGYLASLPLIKEIDNKIYQIRPMALLKYAPGHMRDLGKDDGYRLTYDKIFDLNKSGALDVVDAGFGTSLGLSFDINEQDENNSIGRNVFSFDFGQVFNEQSNSDMPGKTSLNKENSDFVGTASYNFTNNINLKFDFNLDENYEDFNYSEIQTSVELNKFKFDISYLEENNHVGSDNYLSAGFNYSINNTSNLSFSAKRNFETNSAEFYNLSYEYINDCLKAGLVFRREFYTDKDLEQEDTLMFKVTFRPFDALSSPNLK